MQKISFSEKSMTTDEEITEIEKLRHEYAEWNTIFSALNYSSYSNIQCYKIINRAIQKTRQKMEKDLVDFDWKLEYELKVKDEGRKELAEEILLLLDVCNDGKDVYEPDMFMEKVNEKLQKDVENAKS